MRVYEYKGKENTCLWCGKPFREIYDTVPGPAAFGMGSRTPDPPPAPGELHVGYTVARVVGYTVDRVGIPDGGTKHRIRKAKPGDPVETYRIYYDPPRWNAWFADEPYFDTGTCARKFALRAAQIGTRFQPIAEESSS